jgi:putative endonuclease
MENRYFVYILTNKGKTVLYTGVTNDLLRRIAEHKQGITKGFTSRYNIKNLIYFEEYQDVNQAIQREKEIKGWRRQKKVDLILKSNPDLKDLYDEICE